MVDSISELIFYHFPNYFLAVLFWTLLGRYVLMFFVAKNPSNYIYVFFCRLTDWFILLINPIIPRFLPPSLIPAYVVFIIFLLRFLFWIFAYNMGFVSQDVTNP